MRCWFVVNGHGEAARRKNRGVYQRYFAVVHPSVRHAGWDEEHIPGARLDRCLANGIGASPRMDNDEFLGFVVMETGELPRGRFAEDQRQVLQSEFLTFEKMAPLHHFTPRRDEEWEL